MPIKDPEKKKKWQKEWNDRRIAEGYGKALYARRKKRFENEKVLRTAIERSLHLTESGDEADHILNQIEEILTKAIEDAPPVTGKPLDFMPDKKEKEE